MKVLRFITSMALITAINIQFASAAFIKVKISGTVYHDENSVLVGEKISNAELISDCTDNPGAQLVAEVNDIEVGPTVIVTVSPCGVVLCTNLVLTTDCSQSAETSNGSSETVSSAVRVNITSPDGFLSGGGFLLEKAVGSPTNSAIVTSFSAKGTATLCNTNDHRVINAKLTISGAFKPASNCPQ